MSDRLLRIVLPVVVLTLVILAALGAAVYGGIVLALFGRGWLKAFRARRAAPKLS